MARTIKPQDMKTRLAIRTEWEANPETSYKELADRYGVSYTTVILAMKRTADEWRAMLDKMGAKVAVPLVTDSPPLPVPRETAKIQPDSAASPQAMQAPAPESVPSQSLVAIQVSPCPVAWEYKSIVIRGKASGKAATYELQDKGSVSWQTLAGPSFDDVLALFGRDGWELANVTVLNHGNQPFTGLFEIVFKRASRATI